MSNTDDRNGQLRRQAIDRLSLVARRQFWTHVTAYALVNALLVAVWFIVAGRGCSGRCSPCSDGASVCCSMVRATFRRPPSEDRIRREVRRLDGRTSTGAARLHQ